MWITTFSRRSTTYAQSPKYLSGTPVCGPGYQNRISLHCRCEPVALLLVVSACDPRWIKCRGIQAQPHKTSSRVDGTVTLPDHKNTKVFKHAKDDPEVAPHKRGWDRKKCKRNKGQPHDMVLVKDELRTFYDWGNKRVDGFIVYLRRPFEWREKEWRCSFCNKKEQNYMWMEPHVYTGDWEEHRRVVNKRQP